MVLLCFVVYENKDEDMLNLISCCQLINLSNFGNTGGESFHISNITHFRQIIFRNKNAKLCRNENVLVFI